MNVMDRVFEAARYNFSRRIVKSFESLLLLVFVRGKTRFLGYNRISNESEHAKLLIPQPDKGPRGGETALISVQMQNAAFPRAQVAA